MPQNTTINLPAATWTQLTDANVTAITFQNAGQDVIRIMATVGAVAPSTLAGSLRYAPFMGERNTALLDLFPGVTGANRVYAFAQTGGAAVVSHA